MRGIARKQRAADLRREERVRDEVIEFECVACRNRADLRGAELQPIA